MVGWLVMDTGSTDMMPTGRPRQSSGLVGWLVGWLAGWLVGWLVGWWSWTYGPSYGVRRACMRACSGGHVAHLNLTSG